jgi:hypothetical protein
MKVYIRVAIQLENNFVSIIIYVLISRGI